MPLGGIGTGSVALGADGGLRQWQLHNIGNHLGELPNSFFCVRATRTEPPVDVVRILQAPPPEVSGRTPLVNDDMVPDWQRRLLDRHRGVDATTWRGVYPFGEIEYADAVLPVDVSLEAFNPLVPLDASTSGIPAALFTFTVRNPGDIAVHGWLGGTLQNDVGGDGITPADGSRGARYGGNTNRLRRRDGWTRLLMENLSLRADEPAAGQMVLAADSATAPVAAQWSEPAEFLAFLHGRVPVVSDDRLRVAPHLPDAQRSGPQPVTAPSPAGSTWAGGIVVPFVLGPGERRQIRFLVAWHFPNRYVDFEQFGPRHPEWGASRFFLGNEYGRRYLDAEAVADDVAARWDELHACSRRWTDTLLDTSLPLELAERMAAQAVPLRTPTSLRTADGRFYGFEGVLGASTAMWAGDIGGSCPLNCTHVWNYAQAPARLFPDLERNMRETEFDVMQAPEGYLPHRVIVPTYLPQLWDVPIGGPDEPALDGMLGTVLKTYREVRHGADSQWLARYWPNLVRLLEHISAKWDPDATGVLRGIQPSTHDIDLRGVNSFMGTLWLAALRAAEEMALLVGDSDRATGWRERFERGRAEYDRLLWNGRFYVQVLDPDEPREFQWEGGCLSDQLIGQWWAHQLDLGYVLPAEHVRIALRSVVRYNLRTDFHDFDHPFRVYADGADTGLLMCSWPDGGRPEVPTRYADEVWSGIEYQVASHLRHEGFFDEAERILHGLWARHDGRKRNPYNEIECGDHYARSLAGWSVLEAYTGQQFDAVTRSLRLRPSPGDGEWVVPFVIDGGWGRIRVAERTARVEVAHGRLELRELMLRDVHWAGSDARLDGTEIPVAGADAPDGTRFAFDPPAVVDAGSDLRLQRAGH